ncbi:MAG: DNA-directed RNA polymerase subunit H [Candidatus Aenigmarchaeota archaeon]|nr:DNA-directed RNA polymerase subunit H [Candidatus Aenigmarchaeota archaeon]
MKKINIERHELVPKHIILSEKERQELLEKYGITLKQLPKILVSDPIIQILNGKVGDVVKIIRKSPTAGEITHYRVVIKG